MWRPDLFPELRLLDNDTERKELMRCAQRRMKHRGWYSAAVFLALLIVIPAVGYFVRRVGGFPAPLPAGPLRILGAGLAGAVLGLAIQRLWYKPLRDQVRRELITRGIPVCLHCGYSLTGLTEPRCPECGTTFDPRESAS